MRCNNIPPIHVPPPYQCQPTKTNLNKIRHTIAEKLTFEVFLSPAHSWIYNEIGTKNNRDHSLTMVDPCTKYDILPL